MPFIFLNEFLISSAKHQHIELSHITNHQSLYCQAVRVVLCTENWPPLQAGAECGLGQINSSSVKTGELGVTSYSGQQGAVDPLAPGTPLQGVRGPPW